MSPRQTIKQVCRKLELDGQLRRYRGSGGKIVNELASGVPPVPADPDEGLAVSRSSGVRARAAALLPPAGNAAALPGFPVTVSILSAGGFVPLELRVESLAVELPCGTGCKWSTVGHVPDGPGLYAFTVENDREMRVAYIGQTSHLWMVTKGRLPRGEGARGGQRYGCPKHVGVTRQRVNVLIAGQLRMGCQVRHWVRPLPAPALRAEEERLITSWDLRRNGWNRG